MTTKSIVKMLVMISFFVFISTFGMFVNPAFGQRCGSDANDKIVEDIYAKIKASEDLAAQISHINITSNNLVVKIVGWVNNSRDFDKVRSYALQTSCVKMVNVNDFEPQEPTEEQLRMMCSSGTKPCGDICIPENDTCNITGGGTKGP